jgi:hypothetical protein
MKIKENKFATRAPALDALGQARATCASLDNVCGNKSLPQCLWGSRPGGQVARIFLKKGGEDE